MTPRKEPTKPVSNETYGIKISADFDEQGILTAAAAVQAILQTGYDTRADQKTIRLAFAALGQLVPNISNTTISNTTVSVDQPPS